MVPLLYHPRSALVYKSLNTITRTIPFLIEGAAKTANVNELEDEYVQKYIENFKPN